MSYYHQVITSPRRSLINDEDFDFGVNLVQPAPGYVMTFVHITVHKWSKTTLSRMWAIWPSVRSRLPPVVFAQGDVTDTKWEKFVRQFGFTFSTDCLCSDGIRRRIFVHTG